MFHFFWFFPMMMVVLVVAAALVLLQWAGRNPPWQRSAAAAPDPRLAELSERADRMQARIDSLERLLDAIQPDWRSRR